MQEYLHPTEVVEFSEKHPLERFYQLGTPVGEFGVLYVNPQDYALEWPGKLDFSALEQEALGSLPLILGIPGGRRSPIVNPTPGQIRASFLREPNDLVECDLAIPKDQEEYRSIIESPMLTSFARYDLNIASGPQPIRYAFTAANPRRDGTSGELAILLPRSQPWTSSLGEWVIEHHAAADIMRQHIEPTAFAETITSLSQR